MPVFQHLASPNTTYSAVYSKKHLPTFPFFAESFGVLRSLSDFLFVHEVFSFLFRSSFDGFCSTERETGDAIETTQQVAWMLRTHTDTASPTSTPVTGAHCRPPTKLSHAGPTVIFKLAAVAVAATWQSFVGRL